MTEASSSPPIWTGTVPLQLRTEDRSNRVLANFTLYLKRDPRKSLDFTITQEADPFFLYSLSLSEDDYHTLKSEQGLVVDFNVFPDKVVELLSQCMDASSGKYLAQLVVENGVRGPALQIVETNTFRHIVHLSLNVVPGNDLAVKKYLAGVVARLKDEIKDLKSQSSSFTSSYRTQLEEAQGTIQALRAQMDSLRIGHADELRRMALQHSDELTREREMHLNERDRERRKFEQQLRDKEARLEEQIQSLTIKNSTTSSTYEQLSAQKLSLESQLNSIKDVHAKMSADYAALQASHQSLKGERANLDREVIRLQHDVQRLTEQVNQLNIQDRERADEMHRTRHEYEKESERREQLIAQIEVYKAQVAHLDDTIKQSAGEINKGNEIIAKLQSEIKAQKSKLKLKNLVTLQQEKLLDERSSVLNKVQQELDASQSELATTKTLLNTRTSEIGRLQTELAESKKSNEENTQMITWLHRQLNEDMLKGAAGLVTDESPSASQPIAPAASGSGQFRSSSPLKSQTAMRLMEAVTRGASPALKPVNSRIPVPSASVGSSRDEASGPFAGGARGSAVAPAPGPRKRSNFF